MSQITKLLAHLMSRKINRDLERTFEDAKKGILPTQTFDAKSGIIALRNGLIEYDSPDYGRWSIRLKDVSVFGEYTTDNGPMIDDWFVVFVTSEDTWWEASNYCQGMEALRDALSKSWNCKNLWGGLAANTDFASRVIWPESLQSDELFEFTAIKQTTWQKIKNYGMGCITKRLKPPIIQHLKKPFSYEH